MGYATLTLSPRLVATACVALLETLNVNTLVFSPKFRNIAHQIQESRPVKTTPILSRLDYDIPTADLGPPFAREGLDGSSETLKPIIFMHSSGSTGLPKPQHYSHQRLLHAMSHARELTSFLTVPIYHAFGLVQFFHAFWTRKTVYLFNGNMPQSHESLTAALKAANPQAIWTVPFGLKLLVEKQDGIDALKCCQVVGFAGSRCPDEIGDLLVNEGVHLGANFGSYVSFSLHVVKEGIVTNR